MIRLTPRLDQGPVDPESLGDINEIIQARIDRRISRRDLIKRATQIGIAAPVVGVMLHATSDHAFGAPVQRPSGAAARYQEGQPAEITAPTAPSGTPQQGGTITCGTNEDIDTLQPYLTQLVIGADVCSAILETLLEYDSATKLQPSLAESYEVSADGLTYTFKLRQNVTFHNGDPFTAQDVIDTWKIIMNPDFGAFGQLGWDQITDMTAPDPNTVVMKTQQVYAPFISYMAGSGSFISPSKEIAKGVDSFKQQFGQAPVGTGPFKFVEWKAKEQITLNANESYWGGKPKLDQVIMKIVPDDNTLLVQLRTGEIQVAAGAAILAANRVDEALQIDKITVYQYPTLYWQHLDLKQMSHLRQTKVRQALDFATPTAQIISQLLKGRAVQAIADVAPSSWAYDPNIQPRPYDLDQAAQLLTEAGLTKNNGVWEGPTPADDATSDNGTPVAPVPAGATPQATTLDLSGPVQPLEIELWTLSGDTQAQQVSQVIAASWGQLGVKVNQKNEDISTIWGPNGYQFTQAMTAAYFSWQNSVDPDDAYYWSSTQIPTSPTGTGGNLPAYFHKYTFQAQIDQLTAAAAAELDQEKRKALYWQIQELLHEEVPCIFMWWPNGFPAAIKNLAGFWPSAANQLFWNVEQWALTQ
jgi:peptide/nickel transport system substrate-binding protein